MEQIKAKQVGLNMIVVINEQKYSKKCTKEEIDSIKNKILLYNKKPTKTLENQLIKMFDKTIEKKEIEKAKAKGIKKTIKKTTAKVKKNSNKKGDNQGLIEEVKTEFKSGNFTKEQIEELENLLRKKKEALVKGEEPKAIVQQQDNPTNGGTRERYR